MEKFLLIASSLLASKSSLNLLRLSDTLENEEKQIHRKACHLLIRSLKAAGGIGCGRTAGENDRKDAWPHPGDWDSARLGSGLVICGTEISEK